MQLTLLSWYRKYNYVCYLRMELQACTLYLLSIGSGVARPSWLPGLSEIITRAASISQTACSILTLCL